VTAEPLIPMEEAGGAPPAAMSIGEVLARLRPDFPDVTISKIRFLESEGLVEPERSSSGYRKFSPDHLERLRFVLSAQRDRYLPLRVIKEQLEARDRGGDEGALPVAPEVPTAVAVAEALPGPEQFDADASEVRLSRDELAGAAGLAPEQLEQLEQYGLVAPRPGSRSYDGDALVVARTVAEMARFGIEPRHLRPFTSAADREAGLVEQIVAPLRRQRNPQARAQAEEVVRELGALSVRLHVALVRGRLRSDAAR
jgi:DNA-binding transcriptional MerR regulator